MSDYSIKNEESTPKGLFCPITDEVMLNPMCDKYGDSYENDAILKWLEKDQRSPLNNLPLRPNELVPNHGLKYLRFFCPITNEIMTNPMCDKYGDSYENDDILKWLEKDQISPWNDLPLHPNELIPNRALKYVIDEHKKKLSNKTFQWLLEMYDLLLDHLLNMESPRSDVEEITISMLLDNDDPRLCNLIRLKSGNFVTQDLYQDTHTKLRSDHEFEPKYLHVVRKFILAHPDLFYNASTITLYRGSKEELKFQFSDLKKEVDELKKSR